MMYLFMEVQSHGGKGIYMMLGGDITAPNHSKEFDFNEEVIELGVRVISQITLDILNNPIEMK